MTDIVSLDELVERIASSSSLGVPDDKCGVAMAATAAIVARRPQDLNLICMPISGLQAEFLIGSGLVSTIETSAVSLGEAGGAPRFSAAVKAGSVRLKDATCPAIHAGLIAGQKGVPFLPIRGIIGSDILRMREDWKVINNPFAENDPIVIVPAIHPDVALFHAPEADRFGNVRVGRRRELITLAQAARSTIVTVERIVDHDMLDDEMSAAGVLPALYVDAIAQVRHGAWPVGLWGEYPPDVAELVRYAQMARTQEGFAAYVSAFMQRRAAA